MPNKAPTMPILHTNGSGFDNLMEDYRTMYDALTKAIKTLHRCGPNQRDYYRVPNSWIDAYREHQDRSDRIESVRQEILAIVKDIQNQKDDCQFIQQRIKSYRTVD